MYRFFISDFFCKINFIQKNIFMIFPIGTILATVNTDTEPPEGWLFCDGTKISSSHSKLRKAVGHYTPILTGRTLVGTGTKYEANSDGKDPNFPADTSVFANNNVTGGKYAYELTVEELPAHHHAVPMNGIGFYEHKNNFPWGSGVPHNVDDDKTRDTGSNQAHYNVPPYYCVTYIIYAGYGD